MSDQTAGAGGNSGVASQNQPTNTGALQTIRIGMQLPFFSEGEKAPIINSAAEQNSNRAVLNALTNARLNLSTDPNALVGFSLSEAGLVLTLSASPNTPTQPGGSSASVRLGYLDSIDAPGNTLICYDLPNKGGAMFLVSKPTELQHSLTAETIEGSTISYAYSGRTNNLDGQRIATNLATGEQQTEIIIPLYKKNDPIYAITVAPSSNQSSNGLGTIVIDLNVDARAWCQIG
jgi:hypothetical protein